MIQASEMTAQGQKYARLREGEFERSVTLDGRARLD
jgi:hypothetical protein